jgi:hypothetical protein
VSNTCIGELVITDYILNRMSFAALQTETVCSSAFTRSPAATGAHGRGRGDKTLTSGRTMFVQIARSLAALTRVSSPRPLPWSRILALFAAFFFSSALHSQTNIIQTNLPVPEVVAPDVTRIALLEHYALTESSGLAISRKYRNVFWTHNDTGDPAFLFAINRRGEHLGAYEIQGANIIDLEAIALDEHGAVYLADTGTNGMARSHSAIHRLAEPDMSERWGPARVERTWYIRFPGEREDCESFFVHQGFGYLISKYATNRTIKMWRFDLANESSSILLERVGDIPISDNVSDATISVDATRLALLTVDGVVVLFIDGNPLSAPVARRQTTRYEHPLMEGAALVGDGVLVTTELTRELLLFTSRDLSGAPRIVTGLTNRSSFVGRSVTFEVVVEGFPTPAFEWRFNGEVIPGATNASLTLTNLALTNSGTYEVIASNTVGVARSSAVLTVSERIADLRITEIMSSEAPGTERTEDWWELTSFDAETNDLSGWRFNDLTGDLSDAFVIPQSTTIRPGESIVFVERLTPEQFRAWWGETNVAASVQIITYTGAALSFNAVRDQVRVWDAATTDSAAVALQVDIGAATTGVSFTRDPVTGNMVNSELGVNGAFQAVSGPDIGSPGLYLTNSGVRLEGVLQGPAVRLSFPTAPSETYSIQQSDTLAPGSWRTVIQGVQGPGAGRILFQRSLSATNRFFRLEVQPIP